MSGTQSTNALQLNVEGTYNLRDVGGYPAAEGKTRWGRLFRSDSLHDLTEQSHQSLVNLGIAAVIDLRTPGERRMAPTRVEDFGIKVHEVSVFGDNPSVASVHDVTLEDAYAALITQGGAQLAHAVSLVAAMTGAPALIHCTAGKDRTGVLIALILLAVGVERQAVVADYAATQDLLSGAWLEGMLQLLRNSGIQPGAAVIDLLTASPASLIEQVIDRIESGWGSAAEYLLANGLAADALATLRTALIEPQANPSGTRSGPRPGN